MLRLLPIFSDTEHAHPNTSALLLDVFPAEGSSLLSDATLPIVAPARLARQARILAIDGGGGRGVIPSYELTRLEEATGHSISDMFHMIAGTSTGGIIALSLTMRNPEIPNRPLHSAHDILTMYQHEMPEFFVKKNFSFGGAFRTKYKSGRLYNKLREKFGDALFSGSLNDVIIPCYDAERGYPKIAKSYKAVINPLYDFFNYDIARGTSAAPSFFKPVRIVSQANQLGETRSHVLIDGGVFANDPTMCAFAEAKRRYPLADEFLILSLGTGRSYKPLLFDDAQSMKGYNWATAFPDISIDSSAATVDYQMSVFASADSAIKYFRSQPILPTDISKMDDTSEETIRKWTYHAEEQVHLPQFNEVVRVLSTPKIPLDELMQLN
jgi:patatin-like phospholipase/acyl hydrolase